MGKAAKARTRQQEYSKRRAGPRERKAGQYVRYSKAAAGPHRLPPEPPAAKRARAGAEHRLLTRDRSNGRGPMSMLSSLTLKAIAAQRRLQHLTSWLLPGEPSVA